jgi:radical SAM/Cys-rich protein
MVNGSDILHRTTPCISGAVSGNICFFGLFSGILDYQTQISPILLFAVQRLLIRKKGGFMSIFESRATGGEGLNSRGIDIIQVNIGLRCNQSCRHCHLDASPSRTEAMDWTLMQQVISVCRASGCTLVDITGGAPELNPHFREFVHALRGEHLQVQVRTNLTVLTEPGMDDMPEFFRDHAVRLTASLPCYTEENVRAQRGPLVYGKSIQALKQLNGLGYGTDADLPLNLVYNPGGPFLPGEQSALEVDYRRELQIRFGISFTRLLTITNMPLGKFRFLLLEENGEDSYLKLLENAFNPLTIPGLMCRNQLSIGWDGTLYDCDFNLALDKPVNHGSPDHISRFDRESLATRRIVLGDHCFGCTAGHGSSCAGSIA